MKGYKVCRVAFEINRTVHCKVKCNVNIANLVVMKEFLGETWSSSSDAKKLNFLLCGVKSVNYVMNCALFHEVQTLIANCVCFLQHDYYIIVSPLDKRRCFWGKQLEICLN